MTALLRILLYLTPMSHAVRMRMMVRLQLSAYLNWMMDAQTGELRDVEPVYLAHLDRMIRGAETLLAYAIWLHARDMGGFSARPISQWTRTPGNPRVSIQTLFVRLERLVHRLAMFEASARRQRARLDAPDRAVHPAPVSPGFRLPCAIAPRALALSG